MSTENDADAPIWGADTAYARGYREGFHTGAASALRCAAGRLGPKTWAIIDAIEADYEPGAGGGVP